jgi:arylsulfatase A-like enzyme/Tfp pilus assembly protein PilF
MGLLLAGCSRPVRPPDVLLVTIDTLRADHLGCYGFSLARTPQIDRLSREGVLCSDAVAAAPITLPSHCSIMTGLYPPAHGVRDNGAYALGDRAVTLAERLKGAGYETQAFVSALVLNRRYGLAQGFDGYDDDLWAENEPKLFMIRDRKARKTADRVLEWLDRRKEALESRPYFAWVHFFDPHQPYVPEAEDRLFAPTLYDGEIGGVDRALGRILDRLRKDGTLDRTLVVVTADHGESLGEHDEKTHAVFIYDATVRVPLIFRYPRLLPAGRRYEGPVRSVDIVPTILSALKLPGGDETQGADLLAALAGRADPPKLSQYSESLLSEVGFGMAPLYGIRNDGFKWIRAPRPELYDLKKDAREVADIHTEEPRRSAILDRDLERIFRASERFAVDSRENPLDRETVEMLRSLGYLASASERKSMGGMDPKDGIRVYNLLEEARHLAQKDEWEKSEAVLRKILAEIPEHVSARNILALTLLRQGRLEDARDEYKRSLKSDPKQARVLAMLGTIALLEGNLDEAERVYKATLQASPAFVEAMANLGFIETLRGNSDEARKWFDAAQAADPTFPRARKLSGDLFYERKEYARALAEYERVLRTVPRHFDALIQAGNCARRTGDPAGATAFFKRAATLRPDSWIPDYNLACLDASVGRTDDALSRLTKALPEKGFHAILLLEKDPDLAALRPLPGFAALTEKIRSQPVPMEDD